MGKHIAVSPARHKGGDGRWSHRVMMVATLGLAFGLLSGVSDASSPSTDVHFTPLTPPHKIISNTGIGANATRVAVASGGSTQVPLNATTVRFTVTVKGTKAGTLSWYPTGNPAGATGESISWAANGTNTGTFSSDIGQKNSISFKNTSLATATTTVTVTGYSTEVEARDISGIGGTKGEVLTNDGEGGASWEVPSHAYSWQNVSSYPLQSSPAPVAYVDVPAGKYLVSFSAGIYNGAAGCCYKYANCQSNIGLYLAESTHHDDPTDLLSAQRVFVANTPTHIFVNCDGYGMTITNPTLIALKVGEVTIN